MTKIKSREELFEIIGCYPRENKVIMANGCFDIVHPGHIRHLKYAKTKASVLVVSITSDRYIEKREIGPHVPQNLRAENLAALEMVDYVIIDDYKKPLDLLAFLQPDYYVKGYDYHPGQRETSIEETDTITHYGGEVIYSPGDVVYTSSKIIKENTPNIKFDKLLDLMKRENVTFEQLKDTLNQTNHYHVHVLGDTIIDTLTTATLIGGQVKTPTISALFENKQDFIGGAAIVAKHLKEAGSFVTFTTVLGNGNYRDFVLEELNKSGIVVKAIMDDSRPVTNKNLFMVDGYRMLKIDTLDNRTISNGVLRNITQCIKASKANAMVFSDFRHGIFSRRTITPLIEAIPKDIYKVADSQVATRWGNIIEFAGFDLVTPNEKEARFALADQDSGVRSLASDLYDTVECQTLMLKLGSKGVLVCRNSDHESLGSYFVVDSFADEVVDPVGAGDAYLAYATLGMLISKCPVQAAILGSIAAGRECEMNGNIPISKKDVLQKLEHLEEHF